MDDKKRTLALEGLYCKVIRALDDGKNIVEIRKLVDDNPFVLLKSDGYGFGDTILHYVGQLVDSSSNLDSIKNLMNYLAERCIIACLICNRKNEIPVDNAFASVAVGLLKAENKTVDDYRMDNTLEEITISAISALIDVILHRTSSVSQEIKKSAREAVSEFAPMKNNKSSFSSRSTKLRSWVKEPSIQSLIRNDEDFCQLVQGFWNMNKEGRKNALMGTLEQDRCRNIWHVAMSKLNSDCGCLFMHLVDSPLNQLTSLADYVS